MTINNIKENTKWKQNAFSELKTFFIRNSCGTKSTKKVCCSHLRNCSRKKCHCSTRQFKYDLSTMCVNSWSMRLLWELYTGDIHRFDSWGENEQKIKRTYQQNYLLSFVEHKFLLSLSHPKKISVSQNRLKMWIFQQAYEHKQNVMQNVWLQRSQNIGFTPITM